MVAFWSRLLLGTVGVDEDHLLGKTRLKKREEPA